MSDVNVIEEPPIRSTRGPNVGIDSATNTAANYKSEFIPAEFRLKFLLRSISRKNFKLDFVEIFLCEISPKKLNQLKFGTIYYGFKTNHHPTPHDHSLWTKI